LQAELITYTDEEYNSLLSAIDLRWSRAETDYLMGLCVQFGLRFNVIADRYEVRPWIKNGVQTGEIKCV
jgi:DNA methyltransferase 1-associated protein 1